MTAFQADRALVIISVHPRLDDQMVDWLLLRDSGIGFSSFPIRGHSGDHGQLTITEQVSGRQKRMRFEIALNADRLPDFLDQLVNDFNGSDVHYWVTPLLSSKDLNSDRQ